MSATLERTNYARSETSRALFCIRRESAEAGSGAVATLVQFEECLSSFKTQIPKSLMASPGHIAARSVRCCGPKCPRSFRQLASHGQAAMHRSEMVCINLRPSSV